MDSKFIITTQCTGNKYEHILPHWIKRIERVCPQAEIKVLKDVLFHVNFSEYAWWDANRILSIMNDLKNKDCPVVHCDIDVIVEKDLQPLVALPYDFIISTEPRGFPLELTQQLGFGLCSGFYIAKRGSLPLLEIMFTKMITGTSYSDQVNLQQHILDHKYTITETEYGKEITLENGFCILGLAEKYVTRDPIYQREQFANHINIDNVGGPQWFIKFFYEPLETLPLACTCGKKNRGDDSVCPHIAIRNSNLNNSSNN
jgi:hypothetical protein